MKSSLQRIMLTLSILCVSLLSFGQAKMTITLMDDTKQEFPISQIREITWSESSNPDETGSELNANGYEYVDLGLPSGTLWATCNVGASAPEEYGNYYAWGETQPKETYEWSTYKWCSGSVNTITKYCNNSEYGNNGFTDGKTVLELSDDAAHVNMGGDWRMPTINEQEELLDICSWKWTTHNGVKGYKVVGPNGNFIFLPAAGYRYGNSQRFVGDYGYHWSSTLYKSDNNDAYIFFFNVGHHGCSNAERIIGISVRGVIGTTNESEPAPEPTGYKNNHAYVDLGLPSGTLWANCNVGASTPEGYGDYFAWGETITKDSYSSSNYISSLYTKYNNDNGGKTVLELSNDAVRNNMGDDWRMPTKEEQDELRTKCTWTWETLGGKTGYKVVGPNGNFIFLPAAGFRNGSSLYDAGSCSYYWSSTLFSSDSDYAYGIGFSMGSYSWGNYGRYNGLSVRGVIDEPEPTPSPEPTGYNNNHAYVDLGLPSGTLWANCNVGATTPEGYGDYFAWGETQPKENYDWSTYKWSNGSENTIIKYCIHTSYGYNGFTDGKTTLELSDDAARVNMGDDWRMPTKDEQDELLTKCTWTWMILNDIRGYKVVGPNGNFIFLPAAGYRDGSSLDYAGSNGSYWSSTLYSDYNSNYAYALGINSKGYAARYGYGRSCGLSVRGVIGTNNEPEPTGYNNNHAYVDLGLPSGTLWATCNVGASTPEEYGNYYAWGETQPKETYDWSTYKWCNGSENTMTKYCTNSEYGNNGFTDGKTTLELSDDAVHVNMGGDWRMPTRSEFEELKDSCTWTWTSLNDVSGYKVVGPNGNFIFLPATGWKSGSSVIRAGTSGYYYSSLLYSSDNDRAYLIGFYLSGYDWYADNRCDGQSVRGVIGTVNEPEPEPEPTGYSNNHAYVDLGLPSGTLWANCNVGASSPEDYGNYYAWGETQPKETYEWSTYKWCSGSANTITKYCNNSEYGNNGFTDGKTVLELSDDAAHVNMGGDWRMPTNDEQNELLTECTWTWTTLNGISGYKVVGPNGNFIFLPAAGYKVGSSVISAGTYGYYWSSSLNTSSSNFARYLLFLSSGRYIGNDNRSYGHSVRGVVSAPEPEPEPTTAPEPSGYNNDHAYVDLGLPSGTLWANCNVGASSPEDYGNYYAWGETQTREKNDGSIYKWCNGSENTMTKYCVESKYGNNGFTDGKTTLELSDDAAHVNMGGDWRMPTYDEKNELLTECTWIWTTLNDVSGCKVVGPNGNFIFLPAAGYGDDISLYYAGTLGHYWSSTLNTSHSVFAHILSFQPSKDESVYEPGAGAHRFCWLNVRGVLSADSVTGSNDDNNGDNGHGSTSDNPANGGDTPSSDSGNSSNHGTDDGGDDNNNNNQGNGDSPEVQYNANGYAYVDLGLPSGLLWATCNVGASSPEEAGNYYAWGEIATKDSCSSSNYINSLYTKYNNSGGRTVLELSDDAAHVNMGGDWRMPTKEELEELSTKCTWTWITQNDISGYKVVGPNGNFIFLPAAGYKDVSIVNNAGKNGHYWSSSFYDVNYNDFARSLCFYSISRYMTHNGCYSGLSVRGVIAPGNE